MSIHENRKMSAISIVREQNGFAKCPYCGTVVPIRPRTREQLDHIKECRPVLELRKSINLPFTAHTRFLHCCKCCKPFFVADQYSFIHKDLIDPFNLQR